MAEIGAKRDYPRTHIGVDAPTHGEELWFDTDATPELDADLDCAEYDLDNVGDIIHDEAVASDFTIKNEDEDKDIVFNCNDGGVDTMIMTLDGSAGQLSGIQKAVSGVMTNAVDGTDYISSVVADQTPQLYAALDCQENDIDNVGNIIHNEAGVTDMIIQNVDLDKDIVFKCNDGSVETIIMQLDGSAGQLSGIIKATTGILSGASDGTDYISSLVADQTPQLYADLDCQEHDLDNVGNIIHNEAGVTDMVIQNVDLDKDIKFSCNDGSVQTDIMILDGSAGQLSGMQKAVSGVMTNAVSFTDYMPVLVPYRGITALRTLDTTDYFVDCTANSFDVTLPTAASIAGRVYIIKNSGTGSIAVKPNGVETIDGLSQVDLVTQYSSVTVISDGTNWKIV